jgi:hypothetical protein
MADMAAREIAHEDVVTLADVKALAGAAGPCITLITPIPNPQELVVRLKNAVRSAHKQLAERHTDAGTAGGLLAPVEQLAANLETARMWANSLIVLRSPSAFRYYWVRQRLNEVAVVGDRFEIRPLLAALAREQRFHLLAIGRHHVRLLRSTPHSVEEVRIEGMASGSIEEWLQSHEPDLLLENRRSGPGTDEEEGRFKHFLKEVERRVTNLLRPDAGPLILAGVEHYVTIYRQIDTYANLLDPAIHGSPDGLSAQTLHERAWEIVSQCPSEPLKKALADYRKQSGAALVLGDVEAILKAASEGRVAGLFLSENAGAAGQPADPLNVAAIETVVHGGWAFELNSAEMPAKDSAAALLRF